MIIEHKSVDDLIPYASNSRTHSDDQVSQIAASIKEFGFNNPILVDNENGIIAGHGRLAAAKKLGLDQVPTIKLEHLTDAQRRAFVIADNKLALNAGWDDNILTAELERLDGEIDLSLLGFDDQELANIIDGLQPIEPELEDQEYSEVFNIIVNCESESHQERIYNELLEKGYSCQVQSL